MASTSAIYLRKETLTCDCVCVCLSLEAKMDKKLSGASVVHF